MTIGQWTSFETKGHMNYELDGEDVLYEVGICIFFLSFVGNFGMRIRGHNALKMKNNKMTTEEKRYET